jgi:hypothetical protein
VNSADWVFDRGADSVDVLDTEFVTETRVVTVEVAWPLGVADPDEHVDAVEEPDWRALCVCVFRPERVGLTAESVEVIVGVPLLDDEIVTVAQADCDAVSDTVTMPDEVDELVDVTLRVAVVEDVVDWDVVGEVDEDGELTFDHVEEPDKTPERDVVCDAVLDKDELTECVAVVHDEWVADLVTIVLEEPDLQTVVDDDWELEIVYVGVMLLDAVVDCDIVAANELETVEDALDVNVEVTEPENITEALAVLENTGEKVEVSDTKEVDDVSGDWDEEPDTEDDPDDDTVTAIDLDIIELVVGEAEELRKADLETFADTDTNEEALEMKDATGVVVEDAQTVTKLTVSETVGDDDADRLDVLLEASETDVDCVPVLDTIDSVGRGDNVVEGAVERVTERLCDFVEPKDLETPPDELNSIEPEDDDVGEDGKE